MIADPKAQQRLLHLVRLAGKELQHLQLTDARLFAVPMDGQRVTCSLGKASCHAKIS